ncbi:MAG: acetylglutamate kinase [Chitinophagales bacterium]
MNAFASIQGKKILIHGGGKKATRLAADLGTEQKMIDGRRITDEKTLEIVTMVYAGSINKDIVARLQAKHCDAIGLSGADGNLILAHKRNHPTIDYGFAGEIDKINSQFLSQLFHWGLVPVVSPITHDMHGQLLNTNADTIAQEMAKALCRQFSVHLIFSFEKNGVLLDINDEESVIAELKPASYNSLKSEQKIFAGMIPKLDNAFEALRQGVKQVTIGKAEQLHDLIAHRAGTKITHE